MIKWMAKRALGNKKLMRDILSDEKIRESFNELLVDDAFQDFFRSLIADKKVQESLCKMGSTELWRASVVNVLGNKEVQESTRKIAKAEEIKYFLRDMFSGA
ncbi:MAG TPA: hypothetical protein HA348_05515 [Thermoplasmata archaeon]|nr:hypothetical protein [Thermoplasmata archaeon]